MKSLRGLGVAAIVAAALLSIRWIAYEPYRCARVATIVERQTRGLLRAEEGGVLESGTAANQSLLARCRATTPWDVNLHLLAGANYTIVGQHENARDAYLTAFRYDRRPELHVALGNTLLELGDSEGAFEHLVTACVINTAYLSDIEEPMRTRVNMRVTAIYTERAEALRRLAADTAD